MEDKNIYSNRRRNRHNSSQIQNEKKNLLVESNDSEEVKNILAFNEQIKENIPDYDELEVVPKSTSKKRYFSFNKGMLKYGLSLSIFLIAIFGVSYSFFNYRKEDSRQADISAGEVYVRLVEDATSITLPKMYPRTDEDARARDDNYFDFTIKGKNTSDTKSILYTINVTDGEAVSGKTRINPQYIKVDLQQKVGQTYEYISEGVKLSDFNFTGAVLTSTTNEITREYRIRFWISDDVTISDTNQNATYTTTQFNNIYATYNVSVSSEDKTIAYNMLRRNADTETVIDFGEISSSTNGEGLYLLPGTSNDNFPIYYYRGDIDNNNVIFGGFCWQIVRTTDTGGIKMIYNGEVTGTTEEPTCENTLHADRVLSGNTAFNSSEFNLGYMSNTIYIFEGGVSSGSIYGKNVEWDGTNYLVIENTANTASTNTTKDNYHHYTCGASGTTTCSTVRYYFQGNYYITLTGGDTIEDAIYKMTGNGDAATKAKNSGYVLNQNDSTIKGVIESWFRTNLTNEIDNTKINYIDYLEDTVYCNDRTFKTAGTGSYTNSGWNPDGGNLSNNLSFGIYNRAYNSWYSTTNVPDFACPNETDRFSVSNSLAHLNYPVGLLTGDEIIMAGASGNSYTDNNNYYLYTGNRYRSMSPGGIFNNGFGELSVDDPGYLAGYYINISQAVRPVLSLRFDTEFESSGDGTPTNPYVVKVATSNLYNQ